MIPASHRWRWSWAPLLACLCACGSAAGPPADAGPAADPLAESGCDRLDHGHRLSCGWVTDAAIAAMAEMPELTSMDLTLDRPRDLGPLAKLRHLAKLTLHAKTSVDVSSVAEITALESLVIDTRVRGLDELAGMPHLRRLTITDNDAPFDVRRIARLTQLREIDAAGIEAHDLGGLGELSKLEALTVRCGSTEDATPLAELQSLRELTLFGKPVGNLSVLARLPRLERLTLGNGYGSWSSGQRLIGISLPGVDVRAADDTIVPDDEVCEAFRCGPDVDAL